MEQLENELEDDELYFRRFPQEKQDSIRALVSYTTLMGLSGKDLISIGGRLDRLRAKREAERNRDIILGMDIRHVGKDQDLRTRWAYIDNGGTRYTFDDPDWYNVRIKNHATNTTSRVNVLEHYDCKKVRSLKHNRHLANIMLNVHFGQIKLP